jgi:transposase
MVAHSGDMQSYHRVHVQLTRKDRRQVTQMLSKGQVSARVLRRASILRQLDDGQTVAQVAANVGVASKTVRAIAGRYEEEGLESALYEKPRPGKQRALNPGQSQRIIDRHGVRVVSRGLGTVERAADRHRSGETKTGAAGGPRDDSHPSSEPRAEAVAGKKAGAWRN